MTDSATYLTVTVTLNVDGVSNTTTSRHTNLPVAKATAHQSAGRLRQSHTPFAICVINEFDMHDMYLELYSADQKLTPAHRREFKFQAS